MLTPDSIEKFTPRPIGLSDIRLKKISNRLEAGKRAWSLASAALKDLGVTAELFGSMARGTPNPSSDCDILVTEKNGVCRGQILLAAERAAGDFPIDLVFAEDLGWGVIDRMREEAHGEVISE